MRLKSKDFVVFEITGDPSGKIIAPMLLIPFVENAFKHGNKAAPSPGIVIKMHCTANLFTFSVKNKKNMSGAKDSLGGIGLTNVKRRLELIYHENYTLDILDNEDNFEITLEIKE
ncbi:MAG: hypothetical protein HC905_31530 [Bacteroidales bacterium]|nr:hypothetical protein [Bacteroidales bacterium]